LDTDRSLEVNNLDSDSRQQLRFVELVASLGIIECIQGKLPFFSQLTVELPRLHKFSRRIMMKSWKQRKVRKKIEGGMRSW